MKVLLIPIPCGDNMLPLVPIGVLYIADHLRKQGFECKILDLNFHTDRSAKIEEEVDSFRPDVIGLSIRNIAESPSMNGVYNYILDIASVCKHYAPIVLGGAGFSLFPQDLMRLTNAEYGIVGEGEEAMVYLLRNLQQIPLHTVLSRSFDGFRYSDISAEVSCYWKTYGKYFVLNESPIPIQTQRGCQFRCSYCSYPILNGVFHRSVHAVVEEMKSIYRETQHNRFHFVDSVFNMDLPYTHQLLNALIESQLPLKWSCGINPHAYDDRLLEEMKKAGCVFCEIGVDSFSDSILELLHKPYTSKMAQDMLLSIQQLGIPYGMSLILGGIGDTVETLNETIALATSLKPVKVFVFLGERLYPGTALAKQLMKNPRKLLLASEDAFYISNETQSAIEELRRHAPDNWSFTGFGT